MSSLGSQGSVGCAGYQWIFLEYLNTFSRKRRMFSTSFVCQGILWGEGTCTYVGVHLCIPVRVEATGQPEVSFLRCYLLWFLRQGLSFDLELDG